MQKSGKLFIISGPSGVGKSTVLKALFREHPDLYFSVSATTRAPREGEIDGVHYRFIKSEQFLQMVQENEFLEYAEYVGSFYGTPRGPVEDAMAQGRDAFLDIEIQGAQQVYEKRPDAVRIFIAPNSWAELERRLTERGTDSAEKIQKRLLRAKVELQAAENYDYLVVNDTVEQAVREMEAEVFKALAAHLDAGKSARTFDCSDDDRAIVETADLLSLKPIIYAANMDEAGFADCENNAYFRSVRDLAAKEGAQVLPICAKLEQDIAELDDPEERAMFLEDLGIEQSGLDRLIQCSYELLGLISFLTYGTDECRAWTIKKGTKAPQAAGKIHSDIERGFIRAETINFSEMIACGSVAAAKEKGLLRSEGKEYVVKDGDMIYFRFNV